MEKSHSSSGQKISTAFSVVVSDVCAGHRLLDGDAAHSVRELLAAPRAVQELHRVAAVAPRQVTIGEPANASLAPRSPCGSL